MRAWLLAALLVGAAVAGFLLFDTTTSTSSSTMLTGCHVGVMGWPDPSRGEPDAEWSRSFVKGEIVRIAHPSGRFGLAVEVDGGPLEHLPSRERPDASQLAPGGCRSAPYFQHYLAMESGEMRVHVWMYD